MREFLLTAVCAACATWSASARAEVIQLAELEQRALANRPALARAQARTREAEAELRKASSAYYPQFAIKADSSIGPGRQLLRFGGTETAQGSNDENSYLVPGAAPLSKDNRKNAWVGYPRTGVELAASANLYDFGRTQAATAAGHEGHTAALAARELSEAELRSAVREGYLGWLLTSELARLAAGALHDASGRRERVAALIKEGVRPKGELTPARADELLAQLELERAQRDLGAARLALEHAVGAALTPSAEPDRALLEAEAQIPDATEHEARSRRALLQHFKAAKAQAAAQAKLNRPQLGIGASAGMRISTQNIFDVDTPDPNDVNKIGKREGVKNNVFPLYTAGLTLNIPLWDGGFTRAGADAARARADQAKADLEEFELDRRYSQSQAELEADSALQRLHTAQELVGVCAARLKDAEDGYELGASGIELIGQARGLLRRAQTEELLARTDHVAARLRMGARDASPAPAQRNEMPH
jgi:outer membrane protein TolC